MEHYQIELTNSEFEQLNAQYPESDGSGLIGKRAEEIVKIHFIRRDPRCSFESPDLGADLKVVLPGAEPLLVEVKGTASEGLAWQQLKVSSPHSFRLLTEGRIPVYRVSSVFTAKPLIRVLVFGIDFDLEAEPRWAFKSVHGGDTTTGDRAASTGNQLVSTGSTESKYDALRRFLESQGAREVTFHFSDAPKVLGFSLPAAASEHRAFWGNQTDTSNRPHARAWQQAGYEVDTCKLSKDGWVRFRRKS